MSSGEESREEHRERQVYGGLTKAEYLAIEAEYARTGLLSPEEQRREALAAQLEEAESQLLDEELAADAEARMLQSVESPMGVRRRRSPRSRSPRRGLASRLKGGVIMEVTNPEQARIAEEAGACAVMAVERLPADIRTQKGVARMCDPRKIKEIASAVSIPVMARVRIGHFVEAQILQQIGVACIDESEVLTVADDDNHILKNKFKVPFVCGCRNLVGALRRIAEGASIIRTLGDAGTGDVRELCSAHPHIAQGDSNVADHARG